MENCIVTESKLLIVLHTNFISCRVGFVLRCFYKSTLVKSTLVCLCSGENGKPFCLAELWPALIVWIHWDFIIIAVQAFQNTKKKLFWFHTRPSKVHFCSSEGQTFYWSILTADDSINIGVWTQAWQAKWAVFKIEESFLSSPPPPRSFTYAILRAVFDSCSSFFAAIKPHRNACYAGQKSYYMYYVYNTSSAPSSWCRGYWCEG